MKIADRPPFLRRAVRKFASQLYAWSDNSDDARMDRNGEAWLLSALAADWRIADPNARRVVIDAGANRGDFTAAVLAAGAANDVHVGIHAFEPGPTAATALTTRFANEPRVKVVNAAASDFAGTAPLFNSADASPLASLVKRGEGEVSAGPEIAVTTFAAFLASSGIARVDFLKLDVEGAELAALRGLGDWLEPARVAAIQFEYGGTTLDAGARLKDFFRLLAPRGYRLAKLFPGWLEVRNYAPWMDNFSYANWVALPATGRQGKI